MRTSVLALLLCVAAPPLAQAGDGAGEDPLSVGVLSPCRNGHQCTCPTDPQNYLTNIPGYVEECKSP
ncbi:MAG TPA: hypothetical protein VNX21_03475 [Candidatus Thermoplasmatota archaeon]|nr:hypothetical protein [Candidatus Thermoplasmatota archaeon]